MKWRVTFGRILSVRVGASPEKELDNLQFFICALSQWEYGKGEHQRREAAAVGFSHDTSYRWITLLHFCQDSIHSMRIFATDRQVQRIIQCAWDAHQEVCLEIRSKQKI